MTIKDFIKYGVDSLLPLYEKNEAQSIIKRLLQEQAAVNSYCHILYPDKLLPNEDVLCESLRRLCTGEPLQYVLGYADFCGLRFAVNGSVLIPRPETELLVTLVSKEHSGEQGLNVLDICTGSGCIAWSLSSMLENARVYGCDISEEALLVAGEQKIDLPNPPRFFKTDILQQSAEDEIVAFCGCTPHIIISNPPYVLKEEMKLMRRNVLDFEPHLALFVEDDNPLLFYHRIVKVGERLLKDGGELWFEINERFASETVSYALENGFLSGGIIKDLNGKERFVKIIRKGKN